MMFNDETGSVLKYIKSWTDAIAAQPQYVPLTDYAEFTEFEKELYFFCIDHNIDWTSLYPLDIGGIDWQDQTYTVTFTYDKSPVLATNCDVCGKPSVVFDSWFNYFPCEDHKHLTPNQYKDASEKETN